MKNFLIVLLLIGATMSAESSSVSSAETSTVRETVIIRLGEFYFSPKRIILQQGKFYKLVLINEGKIPHEWDSPELLAAIDSEKVEFVKDAVMVGETYGVPDEIEVGVGAQAAWYFYTARSTKGAAELICDLDGHLEAGMHGTIEIR